MTGPRIRGRAIRPKSQAELATMRHAGKIHARTVARLCEAIEAGVTTAELDRIAEATIREAGAEPSFKGYRGYPATICASVNDVVVHGIPSETELLREGDILSIDVGTIYMGYQGDGAITLPVGKVSKEAEQLIDVTKGALAAGISRAKCGGRTSDISKAIEQYVHTHDFEVVREYTGHGIGREMHEDPQVTNYYNPRMQDHPLEPGMTIALEPMVNIGTWRTRVLADGWTVETADGKLSAHFEHTIAITSDEAEILTRLD